MMPPRTVAPSLPTERKNEPEPEKNTIEPGEPEPSDPPPVSSKPTTTPMPEPTNKNNILSSDVEIKGTIKFQNDLTIDGRVEGEITSPNATLTIGQNAEVRS